MTYPYDDGVVTPSDIQFAAFLAELTHDRALVDAAAHMTPGEIALMRFGRAAA